MITMRLWAITGLWAVAAWAAAAPQMLVVQVKDARNIDPDKVVPAQVQIAKELDAEGRVVPVMWSKSDAFVAALIEEKKLKWVDVPTDKDALNAASSNKIPYVLAFATVKSQGFLLATCKLYYNGREIWKDDFNTSVVVGTTVDWDLQAVNLARSWVLKLGNGPLKSLPARPKIEQPTPDPGTLTQGGNDPVGAPAPKPQPLTQDTINRAQKLIAEKRVAEAIVLLRDTVDSAPRDPASRRALVESLVYAGYLDMAADEALRAAEIIPESAEMYLVAARAYARLGQPDKAQSALNEALARDGQSHMSHVIRGEVLLLKGRAEEAAEQFGEALKTKNSYDARLGHAVASAFQGKDADCADDLGQLPPAGEALIADSYQRTIMLMNQQMESLVVSMREVMQEGLTKGKSPALLTKALTADSTAKGLDKLIQLLKAPTRHLISHQKRELAQKLLLQATSDCVTFAQQVTEDASTEVAISLGEAIRRYNSARADFDQERRELKQ